MIELTIREENFLALGDNQLVQRCNFSAEAPWENATGLEPEASLWKGRG